LIGATAANGSHIGPTGHSAHHAGTQATIDARNTRLQMKRIARSITLISFTARRSSP